MQIQRKTGLGLAFVLIAGALTAMPAKAIISIPTSPDSLTTSSQSYVRDDGSSPITDPDTTKSYFAGSVAGVDIRNFFIFDVPNLSGQTLTGATLDINQFNTNGAPFDYSLWDVTTNLNTLATLPDSTSAAGIAAYNDLGSGVQYGDTTISSANDNTLLHIPLNQDALNALTAAEGEQFGIGGAVAQPSIIECDSCVAAIQPLAPTGNFAFSGNTGNVQSLTLTFSRTSTSVVPESSGLVNMAGALLGVGLGALLLRSRKRSTNAA